MTTIYHCELQTLLNNEKEKKVKTSEDASRFASIAGCRANRECRVDGQHAGLASIAQLTVNGALDWIEIDRHKEERKRSTEVATNNVSLQASEDFNNAFLSLSSLSLFPAHIHCYFC